MPFIVTSSTRDAQNDIYFLDELGKLLDFYSRSYERILILGDLNMKPSSSNKENYDLYNLMKKPTCYKSNQQKCYDLILTNKKYSYINKGTYETGLSDRHKLTYTVLKSEFLKSEPTSISYRCYKTFSTDQFNEDLQFNLAKIPKENVSYDVFNQTLISILDKHAPPKKILVRANNAPFMNKDIRKLDLFAEI